VPSEGDLEAIVPGRTAVKLFAVELGDDGGADLWDKAAVWVNVERRIGSEIEGTITTSGLDRDGYRVGDQLTAQAGQVFDLATFDDDGRRRLNEARAQFALGKRVLLGVTVILPTGAVVEQRQLVGELMTVDASDGLELILDDGSSYWLPPDVSALEEAPPGEYRLRSSGEVIVDPDYTCTWTVTRAAPKLRSVANGAV
jgi:hypothetical protein